MISRQTVYEDFCRFCVLYGNEVPDFRHVEDFEVAMSVVRKLSAEGDPIATRYVSFRDGFWIGYACAAAKVGCHVEGEDISVRFGNSIGHPL